MQTSSRALNLLYFQKIVLADSKQNSNRRIRATVQHKVWKESMETLERIILFIILLSQQKKLSTKFLESYFDWERIMVLCPPQADYGFK